MPVPIELVIKGRPSSVNGKSRSKKFEWKQNVSLVGNRKLAAMGSSYPAPYAFDVTAKLFFFPPTAEYSDIDNGVKHTIDALCMQDQPLPPAQPFAPILSNDKSVQRLIVERFAQIPGAAVLVPSGLAASVLEALMIANGQASLAAGGPFQKHYATAVRLEPYVSNNGGLW